LNWDQETVTEETRELDGASELFHKISVEDVLDEDEKPTNSYTIDEFNQLYREIAEVEVDQPEEAWRQWNAGSSHETQQFYDTEVRSMSTGDVIEIDDTKYQPRVSGGTKSRWQSRESGR